MDGEGGDRERTTRVEFWPWESLILKNSMDAPPTAGSVLASMSPSYCCPSAERKETARSRERQARCAIRESGEARVGMSTTGAYDGTESTYRVLSCKVRIECADTGVRQDATLHRERRYPPNALKGPRGSVTCPQPGTVGGVSGDGRSSRGSRVELPRTVTAEHAFATRQIIRTEWTRASHARRGRAPRRTRRLPRLGWGERSAAGLRRNGMT